MNKQKKIGSFLLIVALQPYFLQAWKGDSELTAAYCALLRFAITSAMKNQANTHQAPTSPTREASVDRRAISRSAPSSTDSKKITFGTPWKGSLKDEDLM